MFNKIIFIVLLAFIAFRVGSFVYQSKDKYRADYWSRYPTLKEVFEGSQYMMKDWKFWIPDETVYSYAAGAYANGANPILVESTQPPLGKYLLSLSVILFNNENIIVAVFFGFFLTGIGYVTYMLSKNSIVAGLAVLLLTFDSLFVNQLKYMPLLDIFEVTFILWGVACTAVGIGKSRRWLFVSGVVFIGLAMMIKVWVTGAVFLGVISLYTMFAKRSYIKYLFAGFAIIFAVLLAVYAKTIASGYSPLEILKVQKWLFWYHESKINRLFTIWPLIFLNKWYVWWGSEPIIQDSNWSVLWPVTIGIFLFETIRKLVARTMRYHNVVWDLVFYCMLVYSVFISVGQANARYLLPLLSLAYPFTCALVYSGISMKGKK